MTTGLDIVTKALQKNGVLVKSETPSADEAQDGLSALNAMISSWSNEAMLIYARTVENFPVTSNVASYTIGSGQTFNTTRPNFIVEAHVRQNTTDYPLTPITDEAYGRIMNKDTQGTPKFINYTNGYPTATIKLWPTPETSYTLYLTSEKELSSFTLAGTVSLPPGWEQALIYNLSILLAPEYGQPLNPEIAEIARISKNSIKTAIMRNRSMDASPRAFRGNFYNGYFN